MKLVRLQARANRLQAAANEAQAKANKAQGRASLEMTRWSRSRLPVRLRRMLFDEERPDFLEDPEASNGWPRHASVVRNVAKKS